MHFKIEFDQQNMAQNKGNFLLSSVPLRGMNFDFLITRSIRVIIGVTFLIIRRKCDRSLELRQKREIPKLNELNQTQRGK